MNYQEACNYISDIPKFAPKTGLINTRKLLEALGNPQETYQSIHIAGTNGKGSVAKMLALSLQSAGYKVGLFISPHLVKMNERISVNGEDISDGGFAESFQIIYNTCQELLKENTSRAETEEEFHHPAYFEFLFAMAADCFAKEKCDFVVWETGLGGRLDATNTVHPEICVITSIGMDHMQYLGNTIEEIAGEKAGIIKNGVPVIYNTGEEAADSVVERTATQRNAKAVNANTAALSEETEAILEEFMLGQTALYQADNARTVAVALEELFVSLGRDDANRCLKDGLDAFFWPGRMEEIAPGIIVDGAHNEDAVIRFAESAKAILHKKGYEKLSLIFAVCEDKDYESIIRTLCLELKLENVYVAELNTARKTPAKTVVDLFQKYRPAGEYWNNYGFSELSDALKTATKERDKKTLLMAVGSLYLIGEIKELL
ncbi:MAG: bifunctional folylpolyglutamate synthase/dihydrofolate synthase [Lachnospiraceae bacterium]|nr:bifunctional folylpolyglutamate synthase/dihydrofolate synthase [Lachnospiraceae bacterium]